MAFCKGAEVWSEDFHLFSSLVDKQRGTAWEFRLTTVNYWSKVCQSLSVITLLCCRMAAERFST